MPQPTKTRHGGRFRFELPAEFKLRGEGASVKGVEIRGVDLPPAATGEAARDAFWKQHLVDVRDQYRSHKLPPILDDRELRPGVPRLSYRGYDEDDLVLEALLTDQRRGVLIVAAWRQSYKPADRPAENTERERAFKEVVNAFSFLPPDYVTADPNAFHVKEGAVRIPYSASNVEHVEHYEVGLDHPAHNLRFNFEYDYIEKRSHDKPPGFLARVASGVAQWPIVGRPIRSGRRVVAGFSGEEALLHSRDDNTVNCFWMYEPAEGLAGFQPTIRITAESDDSDIPLTSGLWDQTIAGIRRLGQ